MTSSNQNAAQDFMHEERAQDLLTELRTAQRGWAKRSISERAQLLTRASQDLLQHAEELAHIVQEETGKPLAEAYSSDVLGVADLFAYWCKHGPKHLQTRKGLIPSLDMPGKSAKVERRARGVIALISPWNYPVAIPMRTIVPALLAGNTVALKPSEHTPRCGAWLIKHLRSSLGPIVGLLEGEGDAGRALIAAKPDMVVFTGSTRTGRKVAVQCAELGIPCESELGGKDCAIVLRDANIDRAAAGIAWGIVTNAGQNCAGIERVAVHRSIAPEFTRALTRCLAATASDVPHLTTDAQRAIVRDLIQDATEHGAKLLTGGLPDDPSKPIPPTLLSDVPRSSRAWSDEAFGPIAVLEVCDNDDALVEAANDSSFGLGASVWGNHIPHAQRIAERISCGMVWINNHSFTGAVPDLPWVGTKGSGTGITNSPDAILHMTTPRLTVTDTSKALEAWWYPYGDAMIGLMRAAIARKLDGGVINTLKTVRSLQKRNKEIAQG